MHALAPTSAAWHASSAFVFKTAASILRAVFLRVILKSWEWPGDEDIV